MQISGKSSEYPAAGDSAQDSSQATAPAASTRILRRRAVSGQTAARDVAASACFVVSWESLVCGFPHVTDGTAWCLLTGLRNCRAWSFDTRSTESLPTLDSAANEHNHDDE